jgi:hypothetical protein
VRRFITEEESINKYIAIIGNAQSKKTEIGTFSENGLL